MALENTKRIFKRSGLFSWFFACLAGFSGWASFWLWSHQGLGWLTYFFGAFTLLALAALVESRLACIVLQGDWLSYQTGFRQHRLLRSEIQQVRWEKGCGVALLCTDGLWRKLPELVNSQLLANAIRAWLKPSA